MQSLTHEIHFWIGKLSTADKKGTAAYRTVDLYRHVSHYHNIIYLDSLVKVPHDTIILYGFLEWELFMHRVTWERLLRSLY
jgi:hypothetical protein